MTAKRTLSINLLVNPVNQHRRLDGHAPSRSQQAPARARGASHPVGLVPPNLSDSNIIVTGRTPPVLATKQATSVTPIVFATAGVCNAAGSPKQSAETRLRGWA
jgi:hypothetical protein